MSFKEWIEIAVEVVEGLGVAILVVGVTVMILIGLYQAVRGSDTTDVYHRMRRGLGRVILLGLEVLVAGDIIATVAVEPTLTSIAVLAGIVLIRTFLSWTIEMETEGRLPWRPRSSQGGS